MMNRNRRRPGLSLSEVLVALFIMAIGAIAILTLFPLGALQMGQALKDDRTAQGAIQGDAYMRSYWKMNVVEPSQQGLPMEPFTSAFLNPANSNVNATPIATIGVNLQPNLIPLTATAGAMSYPVVLDPMGFVARPSNSMANQLWVGNTNSTGSSTSVTNLARRTLSPVSSAFSSQIGTNPTLAFRTCSLMDGMGFSPSGTAAITGGGTIDREMRYNWMWIVQQTNTATPTAANLTVAVFDKRANQFAPSNAELAFNPVAASAGSSTLTFSGLAAPPVQKGGWLLDATVIHFDAHNTPFAPPAAPSSTPVTQGIMNGKFYRVVSVTVNPTNSSLVDIELQTPLIDTPATFSSLITNPSMRTFIYFNGLSEVFERQPLP